MLEEAQTFYRAQKQQVKEAGRNPEHMLILPGVMPIVYRTREEARETWHELNSLVDIDNGIRQLSTRFNMDLSVFPLDGPVPDVPAGEGNQSRVKLLTDLAYRENLTLRELVPQLLPVRVGIACWSVRRKISPMISSTGWKKAEQTVSTSCLQ